MTRWNDLRWAVATQVLGLDLREVAEALPEFVNDMMHYKATYDDHDEEAERAKISVLLICESLLRRAQRAGIQPNGLQQVRSLEIAGGSK